MPHRSVRSKEGRSERQRWRRSVETTGTTLTPGLQEQEGIVPRNPECRDAAGDEPDATNQPARDSEDEQIAHSNANHQTLEQLARDSRTEKSRQDAEPGHLGPVAHEQRADGADRRPKRQPDTDFMTPLDRRRRANVRA
jgi:hypothetical protein